jgi:putative redox protein
MQFKEHLSLIRTVNTGPSLLTINHVRGFEIKADEPIDKGGNNSAPSPFDLLNGALASCTAIFLRNYCIKNNIDTGEIHVKIKIIMSENKSVIFERTITFEHRLTDVQRNMILIQSNFSPTTQLLQKSNVINTTLK